MVGRKRHALVDTDRRLLLAAVSPADLHDSCGGIALLQTSRRPWSFIALCYADRAYAGPRVAGATQVRVKLVWPRPGQPGFAVQRRRWRLIEPPLGPGSAAASHATTKPRPAPSSPS